jgi:hypothetical protein
MGSERDELSRRMKDLGTRIKSLSPPERLRLAAELLEEQQPQMALQVAKSVTSELAAVLLCSATGGAS